MVALLLLGPTLVHGQGSIHGRVTENGHPLEFANVALYRLPDTSAVITGTVTDSTGAFRFSGLAFADYRVKLLFIGYQDTIIIASTTAQQPSVDLGLLTMRADAALLGAAEVSAMRNMVKRTADGYAMDAADNLTQVGGSAVDLLRNMPGVLIGAEGELTIRGRTPLVLINGRTSGMAGAGRAAALERIPASSIERIEVITSPGAQYDADAEGGVVNIILKKRTAMGTNGAIGVGLGYGANERLNGSVLLNHRSGSWNFGVSYDAWYTIRTRAVDGDRFNYLVPDAYSLQQRRSDDRLVTHQNARLAVGRQLGRGQLDFFGTWAFQGQDNKETLRNTQRTQEGLITTHNERFSNEVRRFRTGEFGLAYKRPTVKAGRSLSIGLNSALGNDAENTDITSTALNNADEPFGDPYLEATQNQQRTNLSSFTIDHVRPVSRHARLETGYKGILRVINADIRTEAEQNGIFIQNPDRSDAFGFTEQIHAAYAQLGGSLDTASTPKWNYQLGLRAEQVWNTTTSNSLTDPRRTDYFNLFPSAKLEWRNSERSATELAYGRRINRPDLGDLNPFIDITDSLNQHGGNPYLRPEIADVLELKYDHRIGKADLSITGFFRHTAQSIQTFLVLDSSGVGLYEPYNFGSANTLGAEMILAVRPLRQWNFVFSASAFEQRINGDGTQPDNALFTWYTKLTNNVQLWPGAKLQCTANYTAPTAIPQGERIATYFVDAGFQQELFKGRARLGVIAQDLFNTLETGSHLSDPTFAFVRASKVDTRAVLLTFGYTFGSEFHEKVLENRFLNE